MAILLQENFRRYPSAADLTNLTGLGGPWTTFNGGSGNFSFSELSSALGKPRNDRALRNTNVVNYVAPIVDFSAVSHPAVCFSFIFGDKPSQRPCIDFVIRDNVLDRSSATNINNTLNGIHVRVDAALNMIVRHDIAANVNGATNNLVLATLPSLKDGQVYHLEGKVDHSSAVATIVLYLNGAKILDTTYSRDRIDSGMQDLAFRSVALGGVSSVAAQQSLYRDLVIYTDDAQTTFPMGPIDHVTKTAIAGAGYDGLIIDVAATDATAVNLAPGAEVNGHLTNIPASPRPLLAAFVEMRHAATNGLLMSEVDLDILDSSDAVIKSVTSSVPSGLMISQPKSRIDGLTAATAAGLKFKLKART